MATWMYRGKEKEVPTFVTLLKYEPASSSAHIFCIVSYLVLGDVLACVLLYQ